MHVNYEYILAGMILLLILSVSEMNIFSVMKFQLTKLEQESEYPDAERILNILLLSPGYPENWGNSSDYPSSLGLALQNSLKPYVLDMSKVIRLTEDVSGFISPVRARQLMGLSSEHYFSFTIMPVFSIEITNSSGAGHMVYNVNVRDFKGFIVSNANVTGFYVPETLAGNATYPSVFAVTGPAGTCALDFENLTFTMGSFLVVSVNQLEVKVVQTYPSGERVLVEGGYVFESQYSLIQALNYATGSIFTPTFESVSRYVEVEGVTYYVKFDLWR